MRSMRMQLVADRPRNPLRLADDNGDGIDDVTGDHVMPDNDAAAEGEAAPGAAPPPPLATPPETAIGAEGAPSTIDSTGTSLRPFHAIAIMEDVWTGDGRWFVGGTIGWRDLPLPLMAQDWTDEAHMNAVLVGRIERVERIGNAIHIYGSWLNSYEADKYFDLVGGHFLNGISADLDDFEFDLLVPGEAMGFTDMAEMQMTDDGEYVIDMDEPRMRVTKSRLMGATIVPFPALQEARIENESIAAETTTAPAPAAAAAIAASAGVTGFMFDLPSPQLAVTTPADRPRSIRASATAQRSPYDINPPLAPPADWFVGRPGRIPLTITDEGQVYGKLALWGECHIGFSDQCVTPPRSMNNYANFHLGEVILADGTRVSCGKITMDTGHASLDQTASRTLAHYDNTGTQVAQVRAGEDDDGIWIAGALMPGISPVKMRALMAADLSGDWRRIGQGLELVAALAVNVPGFHKPRVSARMSEGVVASLVASMPITERPFDLDAAASRKIADRIAESIGRGPAARRAALHQRIHGGK